MQALSLIWGILASLGMVLAFMPCFGSLNWINIPFSIIGLIVGVVAVNAVPSQQPRGQSMTGTVLCSIAVLFGLIRLFMGGGVV